MAGRGGATRRAGGLLVERWSPLSPKHFSRKHLSPRLRDLSFPLQPGSLAASASSSAEANRSGPISALNLIHDSLNADFASFGHLDVWPIKDISPPIINLGNRSGRSDKSKPKTRFKDHVCGPAIRPTVECETWQLQTANFSDVN